MARTISTPSEAQETAYQDVSEHDFDSFQWWLEGEAEYVKSLWPSFRDCDKWIAREDHAVLENNLCFFGVSEYCGLAALWLVPKEFATDGCFSDNDYVLPLAENFIKRIAPKFHKTFGQYRKIGAFSNGEAIFEKTG